jgi:hypothetical protein
MKSVQTLKAAKGFRGLKIEISLAAALSLL